MRRGSLRQKQTHDGTAVDVPFRFPYDVAGIYNARLVVTALSQDGLSARVWNIAVGVQIQRPGSPFVVDEPLATLNVGVGGETWEVDVLVNESGALVLRVTGQDDTTIMWTSTYEVTP